MLKMNLFNRFKRDDAIEERDGDTLKICYLKRISYLDSEIKYLRSLKEKFVACEHVDKSEIEGIRKYLYELEERLNKLCCLLMDDEFRIMANANLHTIHTSRHVLESIVKLEHITGKELIKCLDVIERLFKIDLFRAKDRVRVG